MIQTLDKNFTNIFAQEKIFRTTINGVNIEADLLLECSPENERTVVVTDYWCEDELDVNEEEIKKIILRNYELEEEMNTQVFDSREEGGTQGFGIE